MKEASIQDNFPWKYLDQWKYNFKIDGSIKRRKFLQIFDFFFWHTTLLANLVLSYVFWIQNFRTLQTKFALKWLPLKNFFMKRKFSKPLFIQNLVCWLQLWWLGFYGRCLSEIKILVSPHSIYMLRCAIWYHLHNFKNVKNTHERVLSKSCKASRMLSVRKTC